MRDRLVTQAVLVAAWAVLGLACFVGAVISAAVGGR